MNRIHFGLSILSFFSLVACVQVKTISCGNCDTPPPPQVTGPLCQLNPSITTLNPPITTVLRQENSAWCWATSTTLVINHLEPLLNLKQCAAVHNTLKPEREAYEDEYPAVSVDCCLVTDDKMSTYDPQGHPQPRDKDVPGSVFVCHSAGRPEWALSALGYDNRFQMIQWNPGSTDPQGLGWPELTGQICSNRPFISVKLWDGGGAHTEVVTGYRLDPDAWVVLDTHGMDEVYTIPYGDYLGKPGEYVHVRDYYNIGL